VLDVTMVVTQENGQPLLQETGTTYGLQKILQSIVAGEAVKVKQPVLKTMGFINPLLKLPLPTTPPS